MSVAVLIVAAGRGTRMGQAMPKQYLDLGGQSVLRRTTARFLEMSEIDQLRVVIHPDDQSLYDASVSGLDDPRLHPPVSGGATRAGSVLAGLAAFEMDAPEKVLIHDAARPFVSAEVIRAVIAALDACDGAAAALPVVDAIWRAQDDMAEMPVPRDGLWRAQTPQGFRYRSILTAHQGHDGSAADDVAVAREAGLAVRFVAGSEQNFKITTNADLQRARDVVSMEAEAR